jgi:hypothetical protein
MFWGLFVLLAIDTPTKSPLRNRCQEVGRSKRLNDCGSAPELLAIKRYQLGRE